MKKTRSVFVIAILLLIAFLLFPSLPIFSQEYTRWGLPSGAKARFGKGEIHAMQFSPDGTRFAVGCSIGLWLYDAETGKELALFPGKCRTLAFSPDGRFLASSGDRYARPRTQLWEIDIGREVQLLDARLFASELLFTAEGKTLVGLNGTSIGRWNVETGHGEVLMYRQNDTGFSSFGPCALTHNRFAVGTGKDKVELWNWTTRRRWPTYIGYIDLSPQSSNTRLLAHPRLIKENWFKAFVRNVSILFGRQSDTPDLDHRDAITALAFSHDGVKLACASQNRIVGLWDTKKNAWTSLKSDLGEVTAFAFSADGKMLAGGSKSRRQQIMPGGTQLPKTPVNRDGEKTLKLWNTATGKTLAILGHTTRIETLAFSPDSTTLAAKNQDSEVWFWDTESGSAQPFPIAGHARNWDRVAYFSEDGTRLTGVRADGFMESWNLKRSEKIPMPIPWLHEAFPTTASNYRGFGFSPDSSRLVTVEGAFARLIRLWDVSTRLELASLQYSSGTFELIFSADSKIIALDGYDPWIGLWNTETGDTLNISLPDGRAYAFAFSPDGKTFASGSEMGKVRLWDVATGKELALLVAQTDSGETGRVAPLVFSPDGATLAGGSNNHIHLWNVATGEQVLLIDAVFKSRWATVHGNPGALVFSHDGTTLVSGGSSGVIRLWDVATGEDLATLLGHTGWVWTLLFSPNGTLLVSAAGDSTILVWEWDKILPKSRE